MTAKARMTTAQATAMVEQIEALMEQITQIYISANRDYLGHGNSNVLRDAIKERAAEREAASTASGYLGSFDAEIEAEKSSDN